MYKISEHENLVECDDILSSHQSKRDTNSVCSVFSAIVYNVGPKSVRPRNNYRLQFNRSATNLKHSSLLLVFLLRITVVIVMCDSP